MVMLMVGFSAFQSTPPRGRRLHGTPLPFPDFYFNPLRREGGDPPARHFYSARSKISIHSAARAETSRPWTARSVQRISIHSAARAET